MRVFAAVLLCVLCLGAADVRSQHMAGSIAGTPSKDLQSALTGEWTGVLEYRDYSEPPTSTKRVKLPTWLSVAPSGGSLRFRYTYDDGPAKTVFQTDLITIDVPASTWTTTPEDRTESGGTKAKTDVAGVTGLQALKNGHGVLVLAGSGTDSGQPAEVRTTIRVGRNILEFLRETRRGKEEFQFRDSYTFVRAQPPAAAIAPPA